MNAIPAADGRRKGPRPNSLLKLSERHGIVKGFPPCVDHTAFAVVRIRRSVYYGVHYNTGTTEMPMITIDHIEKALADHEPALVSGRGLMRAAVALVISDSPSGPRVLFMKRAENEHDPWSGNICLPGGKVENGDGGPRLTAERETLEEVGLDLGRARLLGRLSDIAGVRVPVHLSCFVYETAETGPFRLMDEEVQDAFWAPLADLTDPARHGEKVVRFDGQVMVRPGISLPRPGEPVLWGLTYQLVMDLLGLVGRESA